MEKMQAKESKTEAEEEPMLEEMGGNVPIVDEELLLGLDGEVVLEEDGWSGRSEKTAPSFVEVLDKIKKEEKKNSARKTRSEEDVLRGDSSWAAQMEMEVSIKDRRKLLKGWHKFIVASEKLETEMKEKIGLFTTCSSRAKNSIIAPVKKFGEELRGRWEEIGGETWIKAVMTVMSVRQIENGIELEKALLEGGTQEKEENEKLKKDIFNFQELHKTEKRELELKVEKLEEELDRARRRLEVAEKAAKSEKKRALEMKSNLERAASESDESDDYDEIRKQIQARSTRAGPGRRWSRSSAQPQAKDCKRTPETYSAGTSKWDVESVEVKRKVSSWLEENSERRGIEESVKLRRTQKREEERSEAESWRSRESEKMIKSTMISMSKMMRSSAMPEPKVFDGMGNFGEFRRTFMMKYKEVVEEDADLVAIVEEKYLQGAAKMLFRSIENRFGRPIKEVFEEFEQRLRRRQGDSRTHALAEFDGLRRGVNQRMWEYIPEIEKWSQKAYPNLDKESLSQMRVTKLMMAVKADHNLQNLLVMKRRETAPEEQYETLKDIVLQQENERRHNYNQRFRETQTRNRESLWRENEVGKGQEAWKIDQKRNGEVGESREDNGNGTKCFNCGGIGHVARQCTSKIVYRIEKKENTVESGIVETERVEQCEILGQKRKIVIDSGSVVSAISAGSWEKLKRGCKDWKKTCEVLKKPNFTLMDASKSMMGVKEQVRLEITIKDRKAVIIFQIIENDKEMFLLGTNAFKDVGIELKWKPRKSVSEEQIGRYRENAGEYKYRHSQERKRAHGQARANVKKEQEKAKKWFDEKNKVEKIKFPVVGDRVQELVIETKAKRGKRAVRKEKDVRHVQSVTKMKDRVTNNESFRSIIRDGCRCTAKCTEILDGCEYQSADELSMALAIRGKGISPENQMLAVKSSEAIRERSEGHKEEALRRFSRRCKSMAEAVMIGEVDDDWIAVAGKLREEIEWLLLPKKTVIRNQHIILAAPRTVGRDELVFEVRSHALEKWPEGYDLSKVQEVVIL
uniref:CCHC-type domain-containing protein n=1 Tax=Caenorhabditis japonica TaxID=281687 RepID=A0A8R1IDP0_CAEJA